MIDDVPGQSPASHSDAKPCATGSRTVRFACTAPNPPAKMADRSMIMSGTVLLFFGTTRNEPSKVALPGTMCVRSSANRVSTHRTGRIGVTIVAQVGE